MAHPARAPGRVTLRSVRPGFHTATVFWRQRNALPQVLILFVTSRCNARCDFCLYWDQINDPVPRSRELTVEEIDRVAAGYGPLHNLSLSGGEPFVRSDIAGICQPFIDHCDTKIIDIPSNFWFTDKMVASMEELAGRNPEVLIELQLSIDHLGAAHDESRKVKGLFERAQATMRALDPVRRAHPNLRVKANMVWLERNRDDLDRIAEGIAETFDIDRVHLAFPNQVLPPEGDPAVAAELEAFRTALLHLAETNPGPARDPYSIGIRAAREVQQRILAQAASGERPLGDVCEAGRWIAVIDEKGDVFPCEPLWQSVGNLRDHDYDMRAILTGEAYEAFRSERLCNGSCNCTWGVAASASIASRPRFAPELTARSVRVALRHRRQSVPTAAGGHGR